VKDERLVSKMEGTTTDVSRRLKQFDVFTWLTYFTTDLHRLVSFIYCRVNMLLIRNALQCLPWWFSA